MIAPGVMPNWGAASVTEIHVTSLMSCETRAIRLLTPELCVPVCSEQNLFFYAYLPAVPDPKGSRFKTRVAFFGAFPD